MMRTFYQPDLRAHVTVETVGDFDRVRHILHTDAYFRSDQRNARLAVSAYLLQMAEELGLVRSQLEHLSQRVSFIDPRRQAIEYRLDDIKKFFGSTTFCYYQTIHNVPVWHGGLTVTVKENPFRIVHTASYGHADVSLTLPPAAVLESVRSSLLRINAQGRDVKAARFERREPVPARVISFRRIFARALQAAGASWREQIRPTAGRFFIYRYDPSERLPASPPRGDAKRKGQAGPEAWEVPPTLPLPPVPKKIRPGDHYLVAEIIFLLGRRAKQSLYWQMLVEVQTGAILYLRALTSGVNGMVFTYDPKTSTGALTNTVTQGNSVLNPLRNDVTLTNLDAPVAGRQSLSGSHVAVVDANPPAVAAPTEATGTDFDYDARTDNFGAVNAYYHANNVFDVIEDLGFVLSNYFDGTSFPVHVDHRASTKKGPATGVEVNAFCDANADDNGIGVVGFCLSDDTNPTDPLGRSVDKWVHWHEVGGHGILWDHVHKGTFGFAHSAGDALAAFQNDPESQLRAVPERFQYAPFRTSNRWFNRDVADGWGWGGVKDLRMGVNGINDGGYQSEEILATTLFRLYRSLGGDAEDVNKRWEAARVATYLVLNAVGKLSPGTNPPDPDGFYNTLVDADADDWTREGWAGGAYNKVIRWAFEKQGLFQAPKETFLTTQAGAPPAVDLYIDDGRGGEYQYIQAHWNNGSVWNRQAADGGTVHEPAIEGVDNHAYVRVKNRGTANASGTVTLFHGLPGAGLTWPTDFAQATPVAGLATGNVLANNGNDVVVGPFTWQPDRNVHGHDCLLAIVSAAGDPSNVDKLEPGQTIPEWRLVPHDNNIGQRNVQIVSGGGGGDALAADLQGAVFVAGNTFNHAARFSLRIDVPRVLVAKNWGIGAAAGGDAFVLQPGQKRRIELQVSPGGDFTADDIRRADDRAVRVTLHGDGKPIGGMTYQIDPGRVKPSRGGHGPAGGRSAAAAALLDSLKLPGQKVKKVRVKKVSLDIELDNDD
jgi:hypothetical protein